MVHIPNKAGAAGMINDLVVGDVEAAIHQRRQHRRDDQGRQPAPDRRAGREAAAPSTPTSRRSRRPAIPGVGTLHWQSMLAPAGTPKEVLATLHKAILEAAKAPQLQEAFAKQLRHHRARTRRSRRRRPG